MLEGNRGSWITYPELVKKKKNRNNKRIFSSESFVWILPPAKNLKSDSFFHSTQQFIFFLNRLMGSSKQSKPSPTGQTWMLTTCLGFAGFLAAQRGTGPGWAEGQSHTFRPHSKHELWSRQQLGAAAHQGLSRHSNKAAFPEDTEWCCWRVLPFSCLLATREQRPPRAALLQNVLERLNRKTKPSYRWE